MKTLWAALLVVALSSPLFAQNPRRDGNWWLTLPEAAKSTYVVGFFDGMELGKNFTFWPILKDKDQSGCAKSGCVGQALTSYESYYNKYLTNVTAGQLADGLDVFYKDYRNRSIGIADAVWVVLNTIAGTPQPDLDKLLEGFRGKAMREKRE